MNQTDGTEAIQVVIRIRPMQKHEKSKGDISCCKPISNNREVQLIVDDDEAQTYKCNYCFAKETTQSEFFHNNSITDLINSSIEGYRACVLSFGQTGAG